MSASAIIAVSLLVFAASVSLFKVAAGHLALTKPNLISYVFYYNIVVQTFIGAVLAALHVDHHYIIGTVSDQARTYGWASVMYMMVMFPMGMVLAKWLFAGRRPVAALLDAYVDKDVNCTMYAGNGFKYAVGVFSLIAVAACIYVFIEIGYYPFVKLFTSSGDTLAVLREQSNRSFAGSVYVRNVIALGLTPFLSYAWYFYYRNSRSARDGFMFILTAIMAASILYYDFEKSPILWYALSFVFAHYYMGGTVNKKYLVTAVALVMGGVVFFYSVSGVGGAELLAYNAGPIGRLVLTQVAGLFLSFDIFPHIHHFIGLASLSDVLDDIFGMAHVDRSARIAMAYFNPRGIDDGVAGVINTIFIAEAWSNFGWVGVVLSPLWVGMVIESMYLFFLKGSKNPLYMALFVWFSVRSSVTGGFNDYIYNPGVLTVILVVVVIMALGQAFGRSGGGALTRLRQ